MFLDDTAFEVDDLETESLSKPVSNQRQTGFSLNQGRHQTSNAFSNRPGTGQSDNGNRLGGTSPLDNNDDDIETVDAGLGSAGTLTQPNSSRARMLAQQRELQLKKRQATAQSGGMVRSSAETVSSGVPSPVAKQFTPSVRQFSAPKTVHESEAENSSEFANHPGVSGNVGAGYQSTRRSIVNEDNERPTRQSRARTDSEEEEAPRPSNRGARAVNRAVEEEDETDYRRGARAAKPSTRAYNEDDYDGDRPERGAAGRGGRGYDNDSRRGGWGEEERGGGRGGERERARPKGGRFDDDEEGYGRGSSRGGGSSGGGGAAGGWGRDYEGGRGRGGGRDVDDDAVGRPVRRPSEYDEYGNRRPAGGSRGGARSRDEDRSGGYSRGYDERDEEEDYRRQVGGRGGGGGGGSRAGHRDRDDDDYDNGGGAARGGYSEYGGGRERGGGGAGGGAGYDRDRDRERERFVDRDRERERGGYGRESRDYGRGESRDYGSRGYGFEAGEDRWDRVEGGAAADGAGERISSRRLDRDDIARQMPAPTPLDMSNMRRFLTAAIPKGAGVVQCYIRRDKSGTNKLFPVYSLYLKEGDKFLMSSKKRPHNKTSNYLISMGERDLNRDSVNYLGKLRSNFVGTEFQIFDDGEADGPEEGETTGTGKHARKELGVCTYAPNVLGSRGPRKMQVAVPAVDENDRMILWKGDKEADMLQRLRDRNFRDLVYMINKPPRWNEQVGAYVLNFNGRVTMASVKNFQLVDPDEQGTVLLQFGRVGKDEFTMDMQWPLSPFQAFAITLSSFDSKIACD